MGFTFSSDPKNSDRDKVRLLVGDTDSDNQLVSDETIDWALTREGNFFQASALVADIIAAEQARNPDKTIRDLSVSFSQRIENYRQLAEEYRERGAQAGSWKALTESLSKDAKDAFDDDDDLVTPEFERDQHLIHEDADDEDWHHH
jgi:hypothetical protein